MHTVSVIGCGYWGPNLIRNCMALQQCNVKYLCDQDESRLKHMKGLYPSVETVTDYKAILSDDEVDAVLVATPVHTHFPVGLEVLEAGKHLFLEKPMTASVAESDRLIKEAAKRDLTLMVGHTFIYSAPVRTIKEIIDSGEIGDVMCVSSRRLNLGLFQKDINVAWDLAPHDISIILYILGKEPKSVSCQGKAHINENIEDITNITLNFDNGGIAFIQSSWLDPKKVRETTIVGSKKMIFYDDNEPLEKIKIYDKRVDTPPHYDTYAEFHYSYHYGDVIIPYVKQVEPLRVECQEFLDCIDTGNASMSSGVKGREVVQILAAASESLKMDGAPVVLEDRKVSAEKTLI
jgi:predicted dehydrogenase